MRIVAGVLVERAHFETCMKCHGDLSFGGEMNHLARMHVGDADCTKSFEKSGFSMVQCLLAIEKKTVRRLLPPLCVIFSSGSIDL